jgi:regulator of nucleoside diphosphate kinase
MQEGQVGMITSELDELSLAPTLIIDTEDHRLLTRLALAGISEASTVADDLLMSSRPGARRSGRTAAFGCGSHGIDCSISYGEDEEREVSLAFPDEAGFSHDCVSVMTPIGAALIGLRKGQSITWLSREGRKQMLTVLSVRHPAD